MKTIVKVQRALMPPGKTDCLVYDEGRSRMSEQPIPDAAMASMNKRRGTGTLKAFFEAEWDDFANGWVVGKMVEDLAW